MVINEDNYLEHLIRKNEDALYYVIDEYGVFLKSIVSRHLCRLQPLHEECLDDVLLAVWENIAAFRPEKNSFKNWIGAIARYKAIDYRRKYLKLLDHENIEDLDLPCSCSVEKALMEKELVRELQELLSNLSPDDRSIFMQYYMQDQDIDAIALKMQIRKSAVYNRLSRGRKRLRKIYECR